MMPVNPQLLWLALSLGCSAVVLGSLGMTAWLNLHPCHLCIFERTLFMLLAVLGGIASWQPEQPIGRWAGALSLPAAAGGLVAASYQSWLQAQPPGTVSCSAGQPGLIEQLVEWLGERQPQLFMATGFCEEVELSIWGLSLANWAVVSFAISLVVATWALSGPRTSE